MGNVVPAFKCSSSSSPGELLVRKEEATGVEGTYSYVCVCVCVHSFPHSLLILVVFEKIKTVRAERTSGVV